MPTDEKDVMYAFILAGGPWTPAQQTKILGYCEQDVVATMTLLTAMKKHIDQPRALSRGWYSFAVANMERRGVPIDVQKLEQLQQHWPTLKLDLIREVDQAFGVYEGESFRQQRFRTVTSLLGQVWRGQKDEAPGARQEPGAIGGQKQK